MLTCLCILNSMKKDWILTGESFDLLLAWLDSDRELAGEKYEQIRRGLIKIFVCRGCREAEDLADETIKRVSSKINEIAPNFIGKFEEKVRYFYGVGKKVQLEYREIEAVASAATSQTPR